MFYFNMGQLRAADEVRGWHGTMIQYINLKQEQASKIPSKTCRFLVGTVLPQAKSHLLNIF